MFLLLLVAAVIYFVFGEPRDGAIMLVFVIGIISIDIIQEWKTDQTLKRTQGFVRAAHHSYPGWQEDGHCKRGPGTRVI